MRHRAHQTDIFSSRETTMLAPRARSLARHLGDAAGQACRTVLALRDNRDMQSLLPSEVSLIRYLLRACAVTLEQLLRAVLRCCGAAVLRCCGAAVLRCCGAAVLRCCATFGQRAL